MTEANNAPDPHAVSSVDVLPGVVDPGGWHRLNRITPFIRSWKIIAAGFAIVLGNNVQNLASLSRQARPPTGLELALFAGSAVLLILLIGGWATLSWRKTRYRVVDGTLEHQIGVLFTQQRSARLDRLQAVDIVQPLLGRIFGLVEVRVEVAGGAGSDIKLQYLRDADGHRLRNVLLAQSAGVAYEGDDAPEAPEKHLVTITPGRLVASLALSSETLIALVIIVGAVIGAIFAPGAIFTTLPVVIGFGSAIWAKFSRGFNFTAAISPDGLRLRHGLLETRTQTLPPGRVQAISLAQPMLWRFRDWWVMKVNVAGYGPQEGEGQSSSTVLLPVATRAEAFTLLAQLLPDLGHDDPVAVLQAGLVGTDERFGYVVAPRRSRWLDPISWRRNGFAVTEAALLLRSGRLLRRLVIVPHARTQSLGAAQGPIQRRLRLASVVAHSTPGPVSPRIDHLDLQVAGDLLAAQSDRARAARQASGPERWMQPLPPPDPSMLVKPQANPESL